MELLSISLANAKLSANTRVYISTIIINLSRTTNQTRIPSTERSFFQLRAIVTRAHVTNAQNYAGEESVFILFFFSFFSVVSPGRSFNHLDGSWSRTRKKKFLMAEAIFCITRQSPSDVSGYSVLLYLRIRYAVVYIHTYIHTPQRWKSCINFIAHGSNYERNRLFLVNPMARPSPSSIADAIFIREDARGISKRIISCVSDIVFPTFAIYPRKWATPTRRR